MGQSNYLADDGKAKLTAVKNYFGYSDLKVFKTDWAKMSDADKDEVKTLLGKAITAGEVEV